MALDDERGGSRMNGCVKHVSAMSAAACSECRHGFCEECLVFPFGQQRPPMCIGCALAFAGVRHKGKPARAPERREGFRERRRRRQLPTVPEVPRPKELSVELPSWG